MRQALTGTTISRDYLHSVLNSMADAVFVTAPDGTIRMANGAAQRLTGYSEDELMSCSVVTLLDRPDQSDADALQAACETGETVLRTRAGQTIPVSFIASTIATDDPQFAGDIYVARDITERKRAERRIRYLARYDALTKIPNRMQFQHLLQQAIARTRRSGQGVALLYIDMDRFKEVNDTFGHASGDRVLEVLTERLTSVLSSECVRRPPRRRRIRAVRRRGQRRCRRSRTTGQPARAHGAGRRRRRSTSASRRSSSPPASAWPSARAMPRTSST